MTRDGNGSFPCAHVRIDAGYDDRSTENGPVQCGTYGAVGALIHFFQIIFFNSGIVGSNRRTFYAHMPFFDGFRSLKSDLIIGFIPADEPEVIVLGLQIHKGKDQFVLDHLPEDAGHFISVHLHDGVGHGYFLHKLSPRCFVMHTSSSGSRQEGSPVHDLSEVRWRRYSSFH